MSKRQLSGILFIFILFQGVSLKAQEVVRSLEANPELTGKKLQKSALADTLELPFFDDFSNPGPYPLSSHWIDNFVYINNHFEVDPISTGVATFDGLDATGQLYEGPDNETYTADYLTSHPINLENKENIVLSFFYQPQGTGTKPESGDSLLLEFKRPGDGEPEYTTVWSVDGTELQPFTRVYIPVEGEYLYNGFQFRFKNYVSISPDREVEGLGGNTDYWNLDYVLLDSNVLRNDTILNDVCFTEPIPPLFKVHRSVPWDHFFKARLQEIRPQMELEIFSYNPEVIQANMHYYFFEKGNPDNSDAYNYNPFNFIPQELDTLNTDIEFDFVSQYDEKGVFGVTCNFLNVNPDFNRVENDTIRQEYVFLDYYAYDDGTPEAGYGFQGIGSENSMFAMKYNTYQADTLKGIYVYFNVTKSKSNTAKRFNLAVWNVGDNGYPLEKIWEKEVLTDADVNGFIRYEVDPGVFVSDGFFIGWQQLEQNEYLNVGLDRNTYIQNKAFINTNGLWDASQVTGTVMIRPSFDREINVSNQEWSVSGEHINVYPNPATTSLNIVRDYTMATPGIAVAEIISLQGQTVAVKELLSTHETMQLNLKPGIYMLRIAEEGRPVFLKKIVVR